MERLAQSVPQLVLPSPAGLTGEDSSADSTNRSFLDKESCAEGGEEAVLLNAMSADLQRAFLVSLQLERVVVRTVSWKARSMALRGGAVGLLWLWARSLS